MNDWDKSPLEKHLEFRRWEIDRRLRERTERIEEELGRLETRILKRADPADTAEAMKLAGARATVTEVVGALALMHQQRKRARAATAMTVFAAAGAVSLLSGWVAPGAAAAVLTIGAARQWLLCREDR